MRYLKGFYMALGMFIGIPLPYHFWDEKYSSLMVASIPLVGVVIGLVWWLAGLGLMVLGVPLMLMAALMALAPFYIAGFIHLDGYMDTSDALLSYRHTEEKLRLLKDPNVGTFAVVMLGVLCVLQFAAIHGIVESGRFLALLIPITVISRGCSAMSILVLRHAPQSSYAQMLVKGVGVNHRVFIVVTAAVAVLFSVLYAGALGFAVVLAVILGYAVAMRYAYRGLDGVSGDLLGYSLVIGELCGLIAFAGLYGRLA